MAGQESKTLKLTVNDVEDFCWCPRYYDLKKDPAVVHSVLKDVYDKALHKCFYDYLVELQSGSNLCTLSILKYRWGKEWVKQKKNSQLLCTPSATKRNVYDIRRRSGIDTIIAFDEMMNEKQYPIIINKQYELAVGDTVLTGTWEYVREIEKDGQNVFQLLKFNTEYNRFDVNNSRSHDIESTAAALAFINAFNVDTIEVISVDLYRKKMVSSYRTKKDYNLLLQTVKGVSKCIRHNIRCVSPDKKCYHCDYRELCLSKL